MTRPELLQLVEHIKTTRLPFLQFEKLRTYVGAAYDPSDYILLVWIGPVYFIPKSRETICCVMSLCSKEETETLDDVDEWILAVNLSNPLNCSLEDYIQQNFVHQPIGYLNET